MGAFTTSRISKFKSGGKITLDQHPIQGEQKNSLWLHATETRIASAVWPTGRTHTYKITPSSLIICLIRRVWPRLTGRATRQKRSKIHSQTVFWSSFVGENSTDRAETRTFAKRFFLALKCKRIQLFRLKGDVVVTIVPFQSGNYFFLFFWWRANPLHVKFPPYARIIIIIIIKNRVLFTPADWNETNSLLHF